MRSHASFTILKMSALSTPLGWGPASIAAERIRKSFITSKLWSHTPRLRVADTYRNRVCPLTPGNRHLMMIHPPGFLSPVLTSSCSWKKNTTDTFSWFNTETDTAGPSPWFVPMPVMKERMMNTSWMNLGMLSAVPVQHQQCTYKHASMPWFKFSPKHS